MVSYSTCHTKQKTTHREKPRQLKISRVFVRTRQNTTGYIQKYCMSRGFCFLSWSLSSHTHTLHTSSAIHTQTERNTSFTQTMSHTRLLPYIHETERNTSFTPGLVTHKHTYIHTRHLSYIYEQRGTPRSHQAMSYTPLFILTSLTQAIKERGELPSSLSFKMWSRVLVASQLLTCEQ